MSEVEILVGDDDSTDGTPDVIQKYSVYKTPLSGM